MANAGTVSLVLLIFGPVVFRKVREWRATSASRAGKHLGGANTDKVSRLPLPLALPSNALVLLTFVILLVYHGCALLLPSRFVLRTDVFLLLAQPVNTGSAVLRAMFDGMPRSLIGWRAHWTDEGLDTLFRRLSSWDGRKMHLLIGLDPFISCSFCNSGRDYIYYSIATRIAQYGVDMFLLGILTLRFDALNTLDDIVFLIVQLTSGVDLAPTKASSTNTLRPHRFHWRSTVKYFMAVFAVAELAILSGFYEIGLNQGRWSHWHANRNLAWHAGIPLLATAILLTPRIPHVPTLVQIVQSLQRTEVVNNGLRANLQAAHLSQQILWQDKEMRKRVTNFYEGEDLDADDDTDEMVERLARHAVAARVDVAQLRTQSRQAAHSIWLNSEKVWSQG